MERPAGQAPVDDNDEYGGDVVDGVGVGGVDDNEAPVAISNNDDYVGDVVNDGDGEDENDDEAPEDTRDKGSSEADEKQKERHLYEYCGHDDFIEGDAERGRKRLKLMYSTVSKWNCESLKSFGNSL